MKKPGGGGRILRHCPCKETFGPDNIYIERLLHCKVYAKKVVHSHLLNFFEGQPLHSQIFTCIEKKIGLKTVAYEYFAHYIPDGKIGNLQIKKKNCFTHLKVLSDPDGQRFVCKDLFTYHVSLESIPLKGQCHENFF